MGEFRVSDKAPTKKGSTNNSVIGSGVKVQSLEAFTNSKMTMMLNHNHHHRPFDNDDEGAGPTAYMSLSGSSSAPLGAAITIDGCGAAVIRPPLQPFDISAYTSATTTTLKSPAAGGMAASSLGFPFTGAQWKELQRQAMIYKYMMASVPVPSDLLIPTATTTTSSVDGGFNLRLSSSSSTDPEPGRCRRTDGKKWRCSRDVAPNHKYCERHMHRGRPRSRKPVEVHPNNNHQIKRARHDSNPNFPVPDVTVAIPNPTTRKDGSSSHFLASTASHPYFQSSLSLDNNFGVKGLNFGSVASVSSNKQPRGLEWMLNGDPVSLGASDSGWQSLMHNKVAMNTGGSCTNNTEPQYLNSLPLYSSGLDQQDRHIPMLFNSLVPMKSFQSEKPRGFIDAWSNAESVENNVNNKNSAGASIGKLSLSSLDLSMGSGAVHEEEMGNIGMGLGLMEPDGNTHNDDTTKISLSNWLNPAAPWGVASTPGGPLAEVLRPSTVTATSDATSNQSSPVITSGPLGTMAASPSGVLHKTFASLSDSSGNSSPTVASSRVNSEIALLKFNQM